ncbi:hypothetical protein PFZ49_13535 [Microbacterium lacticum]
MSFIVAPGTGSTPPVTTRVGMPSLCESTAKIVRDDLTTRPPFAPQCSRR